MKKLILILFIFGANNYVRAQVVEWYATQILKEQPFKPQELNNINWYEISYDDTKWSPVDNLPDGDWKCNDCDRYYRGYLNIDSSDLSNVDYYLKIESDDGLWMYLNGKYLGHWGGDMHQIGCVNRCSHNERVEPIYISDVLSTGSNILSVHVSQHTGSVYFDLKIMTRDKRKKN